MQSHEKHNTVYCQLCHEVFLDAPSHKKHISKLIIIPDALLNFFIFLNVLGSGSYGIVFKVKDKEDKLLKALKFILKESPEEDLDIKIMKTLYHPNIIRYFRSISKPEEGYIAIIMELADTDLYNFIIDKKFTSEEMKYDFLLQVAEAINYLHNEITPPIIHRDLKPQNILIVNNKIRLTDFGVARLKSSNNAIKISRTKEALGTSQYMPPELLISKERDFTCNAFHDIWSLGIIIHQMFSNGLHPFEYDAYAQKNMLEGKYKIDSSIKEGSIIHQIINGCLKYEPSQRMVIKDILLLLKQPKIEKNIIPDYIGNLENSKCKSQYLPNAMPLKALSQDVVENHQKLIEDLKEKNKQYPDNIVSTLRPMTTREPAAPSFQKLLHPFKNISKIYKLTKNPNILSSFFAPKQITNLNILFRASEQNFSAKTFHEKCNHKGPTLIIVITENQRVFGGFSSISWNSDGRCYYAGGSFLFSIDNQQKLPLTNENTETAIRCDGSLGPSFPGGFTICDNCNIVAESNCAGFGTFYNLPKRPLKINTDHAENYLAGTKKFIVSEYEVFSVDLIEREGGCKVW